MSNDTNRSLIILLAAAWIVVMAVVIFLAWTADAGTVDRIGDFAEYLEANRDDAGKLIVTLAALVTIVLALLLIVVELAPEEEDREIRVQQAGATTIVPAQPLRMRLEEALLRLREVSAARARVYSQDKGIAMKLDLSVTPGANIALVTSEASRVVVETLQADLGLPVAAPPVVRIAFGGPKQETAASSIVAPPIEGPVGGETPPPAESDAPALPSDEPSPAPESQRLWGEPPSAPADEPSSSPAESPPPDEPPQQP